MTNSVKMVWVVQASGENRTAHLDQEKVAAKTWTTSFSFSALRNHLLNFGRGVVRRGENGEYHPRVLRPAIPMIFGRLVGPNERFSVDLHQDRRLSSIDAVTRKVNSRNHER